MLHPFWLVRKAVTRLLTVLDPPDELRLRGLHVDTRVATRTSTGNAGPHGSVSH